MDDKNKYKYLEPVLNGISSNFISLSDDDIRRNNIIQKEILDMIISSMKENNILFKTMYSRLFFGGSFYDGLRVAKPNEFDLDLLMSLPKLAEPEITKANVPGYVMVKMKGLDKFSKQADLAQSYKKFTDLLNDKGFLDVKKVLRWMEGTIMKGLNKFQINGGYQFNTTKGVFRKPAQSNACVQKLKATTQSNVCVQNLKPPTQNNICVQNPKPPKQRNPETRRKRRNRKKRKTYLFETSKGKFLAKVHKGGPAFTLKVTGTNQNIDMDIDLVPCFVFGKDKWPPSFRENPISSKPEFFIVPKPLKEPNTDHFWRLSFQEQEREIIKDKRTLKPTIKLLKQLRDNCGHHVIASYYLKTVLLWMVLDQEESFWTNPISYVFVTALKRYRDYLNAENIPYFWDKKNNLIKSANTVTLNIYKGRIQKMINVIEIKANDPLATADFLLNASDVNLLRSKLSLNGSMAALRL